MTLTRAHQEREFHTGGLTLRAKRWGSTKGRPVLALHGWLDNCASFDFLAPELDDVDFLAIDLAGQGKSDHRAHQGAYNIWLDIQEIASVVRQLGWKQYSVVGHSRGAMISTLLAGTFPEQVKHLALIESFVPQPISTDKAAEQLAGAVEALLDMEGKRRSLFSSFDAAVKARESGFLQLCHADALVLAKRGVEEKDGQYFWNNDLKLNAPSEVKFSHEQIESFIRRVELDIALVIGEQGLVDQFPDVQDFVELHGRVAVSRLPGDHHLHMSQQHIAVAKVINEYFAS